MTTRQFFAEQLVEKRSYNHWIFILFIAIILGIGSFALDRVPAGTTYLTLAIIGLLALLATRVVTLDYDIRIPIAKNNLRAIWGFWIGFSMIFFLGIFKGPFSLAQQHFSVVFSLMENNNLLPFSALTAIQDPFTNWFAVVMGGMFEEFIFLGLFVAALLFMVSIRKIAHYDFSEGGNKIIDILGALVIIGLFFAYIHHLNPIYTTTQDYAIALIFRIVMTPLVFYVFGLEWGSGVHGAFNAMALGLTAALDALFTIGGLIFAAILLLSLYSIFIGIKSSDEVLRDIFDFKFRSDE